MRSSAVRQFFFPLLLTAFSTLLCLGTSAQQQPNTNATYHQLRELLPGGQVLSVENFIMERDAATFTFVHGQFSMFGEVDGRVTGAVFVGAGHLHLKPPTTVERHSLEILTKKQEFDQDFSQAVLRFTDGTAEQIRKASAGNSAMQADSKAVQAAMEFRTFQREHLFENVDLRLLEDVLSPMQGSFFIAAVRGASDPHILFEIDPHGAPGVSPEEVRLGIWNQWGWSYPCAFHLAREYRDGTDSGRQEDAAFRVDSEELDTSIEKSGFLGGRAVVHLKSLEDGVEVLPFALFPALRVSRVEGENGAALDFVQEKKEEDADFALILPSPLKKGDTATVTISYGGKDAVRNVGNNNYDPIARETWFPNAGTGFGSYARYKMVFHTPKEIMLIATGTKVGDSVDGKTRTTEWDSMMPLPVAGFHLGRFIEKDDKTPQGLAVAALGNENLPDWAMAVVGQSPAVTSVQSMLPVALSEGTVAAQLYENYFGKLPFDHLVLSEQPACDYGQSWPMLVYLPLCGLWDSTIQHSVGLNAADLYWRTVTPHEVAHQWWGHTIGFMSYRDQWMSEGFADASAAMFLKATRKSPNDYRDFWKQLKEQLTAKDVAGFRPIDVGPVTMGFRLSSPKTGWNIYRNLVYPKGAYILHMIQMMMWSQQTGDQQFYAMMHDFVETYRLKVATTEDFKAMVEKHMTATMDLDKNHKMDWFFQEYVYGTDLPHYHFESQIDTKPDGTTLHFVLTQSGVPDNFKMLVPVYFELGDGRIGEMGLATIQGNSTVEKTVPLGKVPVQVKRAMIDYAHDVLAIEN